MVWFRPWELRNISNQTLRKAFHRYFMSAKIIITHQAALSPSTFSQAQHQDQPCPNKREVKWDTTCKELAPFTLWPRQSGIPSCLGTVGILWSSSSLGQRSQSIPETKGWIFPTFHTLSLSCRACSSLTQSTGEDALVKKMNSAIRFPGFRHLTISVILGKPQLLLASLYLFMNCG